MTKKYSTEEIKKIVEDRGYFLIKEYFIGDKNRRIMELGDNLGYKYMSNYDNFIQGHNPKLVASYNPHSTENIKLWLQINNKTFSITNDSTYYNHKTVMRFLCHNCKDIFNSKWNYITDKTGCSLCAGQQVGKYNSLEYLYPELSKEWHLDNKLKPSEVTARSNKKVWWICSICEYEWEVQIDKRTSRGYGCPSCSGKIISDRNRLSILYPEIALEWHPTKNGNLTPYDVSYGSEKRVWWICPKGHEYCSSIYHRKNGIGCPKCKLRKGERKISRFLENNNIQYIPHYSFDNCRNKNPLPFDFYLPDYNLCIEYHGIQHYEPIDFFGGIKSFKEQKKRDKIKEDYCRNNNINFRAIPYWDFDNIEQILEKTLL